MATQGLQHELTYSFPAIRGVQAGREYYVAMVRLNHLVRMVQLDHRDLPPKHRAQRVLNKGRVPSIRRYLVDNPKGYVLSSITASVGGEVQFDPMGDDPVGRKLGRLHISADSPVAINDGQHRRAAIEQAIKDTPALGRETISVVLFVDAGLKRSQQRFADLNRYSVRPTKSITILYDHRDPFGQLVTSVIESVSIFRDTTEMVKTTISNRSRNLFTLSSIYQATRCLIGPVPDKQLNSTHEQVAIEFWSAVTEQFEEWAQASRGEISAAELRALRVHAHGVTLQAIAIAGCGLMNQAPKGWRKRLRKLRQLDWSRDNTKIWAGRALHNGKVSKARTNIALTANLIKQTLGVPLTDEEAELEATYGG